MADEATGGISGGGSKIGNNTGTALNSRATNQKVNLANQSNPPLSTKDKATADLQLLLDLAGLLPGVGIGADVINVLISLAQGNWKGALASAGKAVPLVGDGAAAIKIAMNAEKYLGAITRLEQRMPTWIKRLVQKHINQIKNVIKKADKDHKATTSKPNNPPKKTTNNNGGNGGKDTQIKKQNEGQSKQQKTCCPSTPKPVNPIQGCKFLSGNEDTDFILTGPLPLVWDRQYASNSPIGGDQADDPIGFYGQGFGTPFSLSLNIRPDEDLIELIDAYGRIISFPYIDIGSSFYSRFEDIRLHHDARGRYRLTSGSSPQGDGMSLHFGDGTEQALGYPHHTTHYCTAQSDVYGNTITLSYHTQADKAHLPKFIKDSMGRLLELEFAPIATPQPHLDKQTHPPKHYRLALVSQLPHLGQDALIRLGTSLHHQFASLHFSEYTTLAKSLIEEGKLSTNILTKTPLVAYEYNEAGDLIAVYRHQDSPTGLATTPSRLYEWQNHIMTAHHIPNGVSSYYVYDEYTRKGKVTLNHINNGQSYHFDYFDDHTIVTEACGTPNESCTTYHFDKDKRWVGITDGNGGHTKFVLDDYDRLIKQIDPDGSIQTFDYAGNELTATNTLIDTDPLTLRPIWRSHRYLYEQGRLSELVDPNGNSTQLNYDDCGQLIRMTDAEGHTTHLERDEQGRVVREILANGSSYAYTYDKAGNVLTQTDCSSFTTNYHYDEQGRVIQVTDPKGNHTRYHYDTKTTRTLSPTCIHYPDDSREFFVYDDLQRLITHTDPKGHQTHYEYDTDDLPSKRVDAEGHILYYHYDNKRRLVKLTNENGEEWTFVYDKADNLICETRFDGTTAHYDYTKAGKLKHELDTHLHRYYRYNKAGELTDKYSLTDRRVVEPIINTNPKHQTHKAHQKTHPVKPHHLHYHYDMAGQLIQATTGDATTYLDYDKVGNLVKETLMRHHQGDDLMAKVNPHSTKANEQTQAQNTKQAQNTSPIISQTLSHRYDEIGNRISTTLPDGTTLNNLYYGSGHLYNQSISTTDKDGQTLIQEIRHSQTDSLHQEVLRQHTQTHHTAFDYDSMGRLIKQFVSNEQHLIAQKHYTYDKKGQLTQLNTNTRLGQPTKNVPMGQVHPNQTQGFFNRTHQYSYDKVGRLTEHKLTDHQNHTGHTEVFAFDPASNRVPVSYLNQGNDKGKEPVYDKGQGQGQAHPNDNQNIDKRTRRPTSLISQGKLISYTYDIHGNIKTKTEVPVDAKTGQALTQSSNGLIGYQKSIQFAYNPNNELRQTITVIDTGQQVQRTTTDYFYDAFGRRIAKRSKTEQLSKLNQRGELVKHPTALMHLRKTDKSEYSSTLMLWEGNRQIQEYTDDFVFTTVYDQDSFEPVARVVQSRDKDCDDLKIYHYHNNHLGTPQELTDDSGNVVWANYEFAWGGRYTHHYTSQSLNGCAIIESDLQPIRFQGQFYDVETSLHYNRFRYYDSDVGMFIQRDPIGLLGGNNVFAYAPNPIHWVDVLGLKKCPTIGQRLREAGRHGLPSKGTYRYIPPKNYNPCNPLPKGKSGGYIDRFGNEWVQGPYHGDPKLPYEREWDVQLSKIGENKWNIRGGASKSKSGGYYINVRPDGMKSH